MKEFVIVVVGVVVSRNIDKFKKSFSQVASKNLTVKNRKGKLFHRSLVF